ncbi:MAG: hypothetical protein JKY52_09255 [Flavobacteriales bacterium]|nr:hypothetical protein [Flavobacteriales bacterium]
MFKQILSLFTGGAVKSIENIASEWIETEMETAEAKALMVKTLDPNGLMRRNLSDRVASLYTLYLVTTLILLICESFGLGPSIGGELAKGELIGGKLSVSIATEKVTQLFMPITGLFGVIVSASFGVNYQNSKQGA